MKLYIDDTPIDGLSHPTFTCKQGRSWADNPVRFDFLVLSHRTWFTLLNAAADDRMFRVVDGSRFYEGFLAGMDSSKNTATIIATLMPLSQR